MIPSPDVAIAIDTIVCSIFGLTINGLLLVLILRHEHLRKKDFIRIILNRALLDFTYSCCLGILQPWAILSASAESYSTVCTVAGFIEVALGTATQYAEPIMAFNRFIATVHNDLYKKIFKNTQNMILICVGIWMVGIALTVPHVFTQSLGRVAGAFCCIRFDRKSLLVTILAQYIPLLIGESLIAYFNYKIYQSIRAHQKKSMTNAQQSRLQKDRDMLSFIIVGAVIPLMSQFPAVVVTWLHTFRPDLTPPWVMFFVMALFNLTPISDPLITVLMVKPIKNEVINLIARHGTNVNKLKPAVAPISDNVSTSITTAMTKIKSGSSSVKTTCNQLALPAVD